MVSTDWDGIADAATVVRSRAEPVTAQEVAAELDCDQQEATDRLERLNDRGDLESKSLGDQRRVWWAPGAVGPLTPATTDDGEGVADESDSPTEGVLIVDSSGAIVWLDDVVAEYLGVERNEVLGRDRTAVLREVLPGQASAKESPLEDPEHLDDPVTVTVPVDGDRPPRHLKIASEPVESGRFAGGRVEFYADVTNRPVGDGATNRGHLYRSLVQATDEYAIFMLDPDGHVVSWNPGAERIKGYDRDEILGEHFSTFYTEEDTERGVPESNLERAASDGSTEDEGWRVRADGSRFWASVTITALRDDDGGLLGFAKVTRDMTERRERERQLQRERDLLDSVLDAVPVSVAVVSQDGEFVRANERAKRRLGIDKLAEGSFQPGDWDLYDEDGEFVPTHERPSARVLDTGEPVEDWRCQIDLPDRGRRWLSIDAEPLFDDEGDVAKVVLSVEDVTQIKEQADRLQRERDELATELDEILERVSSSFYAVDEDWQFTYVNEHAEDVLGIEGDEVLGESLWEVLPDAIDTTFWEQYHEAMASQEPVRFEEYYEPVDEWFHVEAFPSASGLSVYFRAITDRKERERELERYERIVENVPAGVYRNTPGSDGHFVEGNQRLAEIFDADSIEELLEYSVSDLYRDPEQRGEFSERLQERGIVEDYELKQETLDGRDIWISVTAIEVEEDGERFFDGVVQDVTERKEREQELKRYETLFTESRDVNTIVAPDGTFEYITPSSEHVLGYEPSEMVGENIFEHVHPDDRDRIVEEWETLVENPDQKPTVEFRYRDADGSWVWMEVRGRNLLEDPDIAGLVTYGRDVTDRVERERTLERQREQLAALNNLNTVYRDITEAVVKQSTREEIERTVCERLADSESYAFAWTCEIDPRGQSIEPRVEVGADGYVEAIPLSIDPEDQTSQGPTGRAARTGEVQVTTDVFADPDYEPWREYADEFGFRSAAAVPIVHGDTTYGVLNIYTGRQGAFEGQEREVVAQLGEIVGHAIAASDRKQALMSDEVVEVEFRMENVFEAIGAAGSSDGALEFEEAVPVGDGDFLEYGTATGDGVEMLEALTDALPHWEEFTLIETEFEEERFELRLSEPPVVSTVADRGGYIHEARIADGDYHMAVHLPPRVDVRRIIDSIQETYPEAEMVTRRQVSRGDPEESVQRTLSEELTDRQRAALEASYYSGFFEWPRENSGEDVAESLDVSAPTFHQHLRKAQRKLLEALLT